MKKFNTVDEYFSSVPAEKKAMLEEMRKTIKEAAPPDAEELISYGMPAFRYHGMLVYYAAFNEHIGFYPTSSGVRNFQKELAAYKTSKGAIQFPLGTRIPKTLVKNIVKFRVRENLEKKSLKKKIK